LRLAQRFCYKNNDVVASKRQKQTCEAEKMPNISSERHFKAPVGTVSLAQPLRKYSGMKQDAERHNMLKRSN